MQETILELQNICKAFDGEDVLQGISLTVKAGEFITLLGSSGCGKTTTLRIIAGLEQPESGRVLLNGQDVTGFEPNKRDVNTVFQNYALFPHMNVEENVAYGLKLMRCPKDKIKEKVEAALNMVQLEGFGKRKVSELSGGQKQRVAIARAIVKKPHILLLDEPLGALDLQLRRQMQSELKRLQKKLGITFIYITHDQEEAINMSDRIAVMREGAFEQIGTPDEVYNHPRTSFVAQFMGNANVMEGVVKGFENGNLVVEMGSDFILAEVEKETAAVFHNGKKIRFAVRSENILLNEEDGNRLAAVVVEKSFAGGLLRMVFRLPDGTQVTASRHGIDYALEVEEQVHIGFAPQHVILLEDSI